MQEEALAYNEINKKWKGACRVIFGGEVGGLSDFSCWLGNIRTWRMGAKSHISGKEVVLGHSGYPKGAKFTSLDEVEYARKFAPISINELKDIDSIAQAVRERVEYTGNIILGNSHFVQHCSDLVDCTYAYHADRCTHSSYIAFCSQVARCDNIFGSDGIGGSEGGPSTFCIRPSSCMYCSRCFEISKCEHCSDCYYSHGLSGCQECFFCFNLRNKRHAIGNLELPAEKYKEIKDRLLSQMRERLQKEKKLPTLVEILSQEKPEYARMEKAAAQMQKPKEAAAGKRQIETAFSKTTNILFGVQLAPIDAYGAWLGEYMHKTREVPSCASGKLVLVPDHTNFFSMPDARVVAYEEAEFLGDRLCIGENEAQGISLSNVAKTISPIAYISPDWRTGISRDNLSCQVEIDATGCYRGVTCINSKLCAYFFWVRESEHVFGSEAMRASSFCMRCTQSERLTRCFEVDASSDCSDCYFCHNCENVHESMFCFNVKNLRYAIGNVEVGREEYMRIKAKVLAQIAGRLAKDKKLGMSIYNIAGK